MADITLTLDADAAGALREVQKLGRQLQKNNAKAKDTGKSMGKWAGAARSAIPAIGGILSIAAPLALIVSEIGDKIAKWKENVGKAAVEVNSLQKELRSTLGGAGLLGDAEDIQEAIRASATSGTGVLGPKKLEAQVSTFVARQGNVATAGAVRQAIPSIQQASTFLGGGDLATFTQILASTLTFLPPDEAAGLATVLTQNAGDTGAAFAKKIDQIAKINPHLMPQLLPWIIAAAGQGRTAVAALEQVIGGFISAGVEGDFTQFAQTQKLSGGTAGAFSGIRRRVSAGVPVLSGVLGEQASLATQGFGSSLAADTATAVAGGLREREFRQRVELKQLLSAVSEVIQGSGKISPSLGILIDHIDLATIPTIRDEIRDVVAKNAELFTTPELAGTGLGALGRRSVEAVAEGEPVMRQSWLGMRFLDVSPRRESFDPLSVIAASTTRAAIAAELSARRPSILSDEEGARLVD